MTHPVVHWEIGGRNLTKLRDFYDKAFGWSIQEAGADYCLVQLADGGIGGGLMRASDPMPPYVTVYVQVEDLEEALRTVGGLGGTVLVTPTAISETASFALFRDPEGNVIGLLRATGPIAD